MIMKNLRVELNMTSLIQWMHLVTARVHTFFYYELLVTVINKEGIVMVMELKLLH